MPHRNREEHISATGINSLNHYNLVHKFIPMRQAMRIRDKAAVEKEIAKPRENTGMATDECLRQERGDR